LRAAANATAGAGVAAVIALAAIHPGLGSTDTSADAALGSGAPEGAKVAAPGFDASGASQLAWGQCGTRPFDADVPAVSDAWTMTLGEIAGDVEPGAAVTANLTFTRTDDASATAYESTGTSFIVLWNGTVVGTAQSDVSDLTPQDLSDNTATLDSQIDLVNCWDGTALPGGAYELVAFQDFYPVAMPPVDPSVAAVDPSVAAVDPSVATDSPIAADGGASTESGATLGNTGVVGPAVDTTARSVSNTVKLVIAGEVPSDPFGAYLSPAVPAVVYPDDYLTPAAARDEYASRATTGTWDMAAGTQRVVKSGDSTTLDDQNAWLESYYGCSADGTTTPSFPTTSADWPLLNVTATLPGSVDVSYGWVVDGNPEVKVSVTNTSGHTLPGFWGQPNTTMYLVKDGKVVATSYLIATDPNSYTASALASADGLLAPDGTLGGAYLWRDVNGCWLGDSAAKVEAGTYTVLMVQDIYLDNGNGGGGGPIAYLDGKPAVDGGVARGGVASVGTKGSSSSSAGAAETPAIADGSVAPQDATADTPSLIAPAPIDGTYDWLSLQVWTSLGKVTVK